jgi:undecaprenyl-phosphate galactose phosphotransferase
MYIDADHRLEAHLKKDPISIEEWQRYKKLKNNDPRVTRVGKIIRRYSLDELPQLFNVLQGKMSLAGPRPYITEEIEKLDAFMTIIGRVKPGITGLWQTSGRSELSFEERIALDKFYVHNWSLWLDIVILLKSMRVPFSKKGAY